jgi:hypothetical protein
VGRAARLGHPVGLENRGAEPGTAGGGEAIIERRPAAVGHAERAEVVAVDQWGFGQGQHDRRDQEAQVHPMPLHQRQEAFELEARHRHDRRAGPQRGQEDAAQPVAVGEGQEGEDRIRFGQRKQPLQLDHLGDEVAMGEHHAFRQSGRPAGIQECDQILVRTDVYLLERRLLDQQDLERGRPGALPNDEYLTQTRRLLRRHAHLFQHAGVGDEKAGLRVPQLPGQLGAGCQRADRCGDPTGAGNREEGDGILGAVGAAQSDHLPFLQPALLQAGRNTIDLLCQLAIAERAAGRPIDQGGLVDQIARARQGELVQGDLGNGDVG